MGHTEMSHEKWITHEAQAECVIHFECDISVCPMAYCVINILSYWDKYHVIRENRTSIIVFLWQFNFNGRNKMSWVQIPTWTKKSIIIPFLLLLTGLFLLIQSFLQSSISFQNKNNHLNNIWIALSFTSWKFYYRSSSSFYRQVALLFLGNLPAFTSLCHKASYLFSATQIFAD